MVGSPSPAARAERVAAGLDELDQWLRDQVRTGIAGLGQGGYRPLDRMAARMVDAQAPGVAGMLRALPGELAGEGWPARLLEQLGAPALVELTAFVAAANMVSRNNVALGIQAEGLSDACGLPPLATPTARMAPVA